MKIDPFDIHQTTSTSRTYHNIPNLITHARKKIDISGSLPIKNNHTQFFTDAENNFNKER